MPVAFYLPKFRCGNFWGWVYQLSSFGTEWK